MLGMNASNAGGPGPGQGMGPGMQRPQLPPEALARIKAEPDEHKRSLIVQEFMRKVLKKLEDHLRSY